MTKAVHLQLVGDLTTEAFSAGFKKFTGKRSLCTEVYNDHGTNFVGANNLMNQEVQQAIISATKKVTAILAKGGCNLAFHTCRYTAFWYPVGCFDEAPIVPIFEKFSIMPDGSLLEFKTPCNPHH